MSAQSNSGKKPTKRVRGGKVAAVRKAVEKKATKKQRAEAIQRASKAKSQTDSKPKAGTRSRAQSETSETVQISEIRGLHGVCLVTINGDSDWGLDLVPALGFESVWDFDLEAR